MPEKGGLSTGGDMTDDRWGALLVPRELVEETGTIVLFHILKDLLIPRKYCSNKEILFYLQELHLKLVLMVVL